MFCSLCTGNKRHRTAEEKKYILHLFLELLLFPSSSCDESQSALLQLYMWKRTEIDFDRWNNCLWNFWCFLWIIVFYNWIEFSWSFEGFYLTLSFWKQQKSTCKVYFVISAVVHIHVHNTFSKTWCLQEPEGTNWNSECALWLVRIF